MPQSHRWAIQKRDKNHTTKLTLPLHKTATKIKTPYQPANLS